MAGIAARMALAALLLASAPVAADDALLKAALAASGTSDACETAQWLDRFDELRGAILANVPAELLPDEQLVEIHRGLHEQILIGNYQPAASDLRKALDRGDYNCLSAATLLFELCQEAGIELEIWSRPGHVWLQTEGGVAIEPASLPGHVVRASAVDARRITPQQLVGKFYYNRGVELLAHEHYATGLELMQAALRLDPDDADARENLLAGLNNWAAEHLRRGRYDEAARLIRRGLAIEPDYGPLVANERLLPQ